MKQCHRIHSFTCSEKFQVLRAESWRHCSIPWSQVTVPLVRTHIKRAPLPSTIRTLVHVGLFCVNSATRCHSDNTFVLSPCLREATISVPLPPVFSPYVFRRFVLRLGNIGTISTRHLVSHVRVLSEGCWRMWLLLEGLFKQTFAYRDFAVFRGLWKNVSTFVHQGGQRETLSR